MRGIVGVATCCLLLSASSLAGGDPAGDGRLWRFAWPGKLLGLAGPALVLVHFSPKTRRQEFVTVDPRVGHRRTTVNGWRSPGDRGEEQLGFPFLLGPLLGGTLYPSYAGLVLVDPATDKVRVHLNARQMAYLTTLGLAREIVGAVGDDLAVLAACRGREECRIELRTVDLKTGHWRWSWAPALDDSALFATANAGRAFVYVRGKLHAFDLRTGRPLWAHASPICDGEVCDGLSDFLIAASAEHVAMTVAGRLVVHATSSGDLLSRGQLGLNFPKRLLATGGRVYLATGAGVACRDAEAHELWNLPFTGELTDMQVHGDLLYVAAGGVVRAVNRATGVVRWAYGGDRFALWGAPDKSSAVIIGEDGEDVVAYATQAPPGTAFDVVVKGRVTVEGSIMTARPQDVSLLVGGEAAHPDPSGQYEAHVRLSGGRIAISAKGCTGTVGPIYLPLDGRAEFHQDIALQDYCGD